MSDSSEQGPPTTRGQRRTAQDQAMPPDHLRDLVERVGNLIHSGQVLPEAGHQAIGAVAAWQAGFHDIALSDMTPEFKASVEQCLTRAGVPVPWPATTTHSDPSGPIEGH